MLGITLPAGVSAVKYTLFPAASSLLTRSAAGYTGENGLISGRIRVTEPALAAIIALPVNKVDNQQAMSGDFRKGLGAGAETVICDSGGRR
jgi:hypothetical protein